MAFVMARQGKAEEYYRRGESLEVQGNLDGAAADYRRAIEILMSLPSTGDKV